MKQFIKTSLNKVSATLMVVLLLLFLRTVSCRKPYNLTMLSFMGFTGNPPKDGKLCQASQQMILDEINARSDILPDYHVIADFQDEGPASMKAASAAMAFKRRMESAYDYGNYQSPLIIGTTFTPGCKALGPIVQYIGSVIFPSACMGTIYTGNRKKFPNFYRTRIATELGNYGIATFVKNVGKWRKLVIFANAENSYNINLATHFNDAAVKAGLQVVRLDVTPGIEAPLVAQWKDYDIRVFAFFTADMPTSLKFLCLAHNIGIRGSRYSFLLQFANSVDPDTLPDVIMEGCTKAAIIDQFQFTFFMGATTNALEDNGNTTVMGLNLPAFEKRFLQYIKNSKTPDYEDRFLCYDRMLFGVIALNRTENMLRAVNKTLRDYAEYPDEVMRVLNRSAATTEFIGIRAGLLKFNARVENDDEPMYIAVWRQMESKYVLRPIYRIVRQLGANPDNGKAYILQKMETLQWATSNGQPPLDEAKRLAINEKINYLGSVIAFAICASLVIAKNALFARIYLLRRNGVSKLLALTAFTIVFGCTLLDVAAALFIVDPSQVGIGICLTRIALVICGLTMMHCILFMRLWLLRLNAKTMRSEFSMVVYHTNRSTKGNSLSGNSVDSDRSGRSHSRRSRKIAPVSFSHYSMSRLNVKSVRFHPAILDQPSQLTIHQERMVSITIGLVLLANFAVIAGVFSFSPFSIRRLVIAQQHYDNETDTYVERFLDNCHSDAFYDFATILAGVHISFLVVGCFFSYALKSVPLVNPIDTFSRVAIINEAMLFGGVSCILFIMASSPLSQHVTAATFALIMSATSSLFMIAGLYKSIPINDI